MPSPLLLPSPRHCYCHRFATAITIATYADTAISLLPACLATSLPGFFQQQQQHPPDPLPASLPASQPASLFSLVMLLVLAGLAGDAAGAGGAAHAAAGSAGVAGRLHCTPTTSSTRSSRRLGPTPPHHMCLFLYMCLFMCCLLYTSPSPRD